VMFSDEEFDSLGFKKVGNSHLYMRGAYAKTGLLSFSADVLIFDEFDQMDSKAVALATRRMNASPVRRELKISTPTLPGRGISKAYLESDQRIWQTPCPHCSEWVSFDFFRDVSVDGEPYEAWKHWSQDMVATATVTLHCPSCFGVIDDEQRCADGRWYAQNPENHRVHGYHIPWWAFPMADLNDFVFTAVSDEPTDVEELNRSDLGLEFGVGGGSITESMLQQLSSEYPTEIGQVRWRNTTLGCDIGSRLHYRISSEDLNGVVHVRDMGYVNDWDGLDQLMFRYKVRMAVVDAQPEWHESLDFCKRWRGRARRGFEQVKTATLKGTLYHERRAVQAKRKNRTDDEYDVQINRRMAMDLVLSNVASGKERWPESIVHDPEIIEHMTAPTRVRISDDTGQQDHDWVHNKPDHGFHACVFDVIARRLLPPVDASSLPVVGGGHREIIGAGAEHALSAIAKTYAHERKLFEAPVR